MSIGGGAETDGKLDSGVFSGNTYSSIFINNKRGGTKGRERIFFPLPFLYSSHKSRLNRPTDIDISKIQREEKKVTIHPAFKYFRKGSGITISTA